MEEAKQEFRLTDEQYHNHRQGLRDSLHKQAESFDKTIITLSTGAVAFSVLVIEKIAPNPLSWTKWVLAASWAAFTVTILCVLRSFLSSQSCHDQLIQEWDETYRLRRQADSSRSSKFDARTRWWNRGSACGFVLGILLLGVFVIGNLMR
jgi:hypothetical protein